MAHPLSLLRKRDKKEQDIDISYVVEKAGRDNVYRQEADTKKQLEAYQKWKKDNDISGIKY